MHLQTCLGSFHFLNRQTLNQVIEVQPVRTHADNASVWLAFFSQKTIVICVVHLVFSYAVSKNKMQPTNLNAHTYANGTNVEKHRKENLMDVATLLRNPFCNLSRA